MSKPSEEDPHRARWWVFVGTGALVGQLTDRLFFWAMVGLVLMLLFSLAEAIAQRPARERQDRRGTEHDGDVTEPVET